MDSELENWARVERQFVRDDLKWLKAGSKLLSPSGDDITAERVEQLEACLEHANLVLCGPSDA